MRRNLAIATITMMIAVSPVFAVGTVNQSLAQIPGSTNYAFTENWVGDSITGSIPATTILGTGAIQGFRIVSVEIAPGSPAPTNNYAVTVSDFSGADILSGAGANLSNSTASVLPSLSTAPPLYGSLTVNVTGNVVASAQGRIIIYFAPVTQVMGNVPAGASLTSNNLFSGNNTFSGTSTFTGIVAGNPQVTETPATYGATCTVAALQLSLANASVTGGIVDYSACTSWSTQITNATVTVNVPSGVTLKLGPVGPTCTITTANTPCWQLLGDNAKLLGTGNSNEDAAIGSQNGPRTILIGSGLGSTTDMIDMRCVSCGAFAGSEIGFLTIQMNSSRTGTNGQHGISTTSLDGVNIHDVDVYYANGGDCFHFDTGTSASGFYRVSLDRLLARVCGNSSAPVGSGFHFLTPIGGGEMRFITARSLIYQGYDFGNSTTPYGKAGFYFEIPAASTVSQNIGEFHCDGCRSEGSVSNASFGGVVIDQQGNGFVHELYFNGLLEDNFNANVGCPFNILRNNPGNVLGLYLEITSSNYSGCATSNISTANATGTWHLKTRDGGQANHQTNQMAFTSGSTGVCSGATNFPNSGLNVLGLSGARSHWYVSAGGEWIQERCDGSVAAAWDFDIQNKRIFPLGGDNQYSFGISGFRWSNGWFANVAGLTGIAPNAAGGSDLGTTALPFGNAWLGTAATNNFKVQPGATTGARVITITDPVSPTTVGLPLTIANGTATMTTALIASQACGTVVTVAGTGIATTDSIYWNDNAQPAAATNGVLTIKAWPTSGNVNFFYCNPTAAGVTPAAATLNWRVAR